ncbi:hypothetical protein MAR_027399 [Mya arenaria]|uniref:Transmembrane protein n=1 Tax=Mya arenaria TaxID=6604 RepID=A0ABY7EXR9_MYAAR|nr:uncharacterized protein LOC128245074 [Mya arenaria]WAR13219.1 hypothetical protein MAR_027399 [Mya arenaria]
MNVFRLVNFGLVAFSCVALLFDCVGYICPGWWVVSLSKYREQERIPAESMQDQNFTEGMVQSGQLHQLSRRAAPKRSTTKPERTRRPVGRRSTLAGLPARLPGVKKDPLAPRKQKPTTSSVTKRAWTEYHRIDSTKLPENGRTERPGIQRYTPALLAGGRPANMAPWNPNNSVAKGPGSFQLPNNLSSFGNNSFLSPQLRAPNRSFEVSRSSTPVTGPSKNLSILSEGQRRATVLPRQHVTSLGNDEMLQIWQKLRQQYSQSISSKGNASFWEWVESTPHSNVSDALLEQAKEWLQSHPAAMAGWSPTAKARSTISRGVHSSVLEAEMEQQGKVNFNVGLWYGRMCIQNVCGSYGVTQLAHPAMMSTWHDLRIEASMAVIFALVGTAGTLITVRPSVLRGHQTATSVVGAGGMALSGVMYLVAIARISSHYSMLTETFADVYMSHDVGTPWAAIISGMGACCALVTAVLMGVRVWAIRNGRWEKMADETSVIYQKDSISLAEDRKEVKGMENAEYDNAGCEA